MGRLIVAALVGWGMAASGNALAQSKDCEELKSEIEAKIKKNGVDKFSLEVIDADKQSDGKVVVVGRRTTIFPPPPLESRCSSSPC